MLNQLRAWQTSEQSYLPHGSNAYANSVFYQWYRISWNPPVVGNNTGDNQLVPSVDNAWLAAALITIQEYARVNGHSALVQKADAILPDMDFTLWYHPVATASPGATCRTHRAVLWPTITLTRTASLTLSPVHWDT